MPRLLSGIALALGLMATAQAEESERPTLRICMDDSAHAPWRVAEADGRVRNQGLEFGFLRLLGERGWHLQPRTLPWKRCLADARAGDVEGVMGVSYTPERVMYLRYPMRNGEPDPERAVRRIRYVLVVARGTEASWDGLQLAIPAPRRVGVQAGYSTAALVRELGLEVDEGARSVSGLLERLLANQVQAVVLSQTELTQQLGLRERVRVLEPALPPRVHYLALSAVFERRRPALAEALWRDVAKVRESAEFQRLLTGP